MRGFVLLIMAGLLSGCLSATAPGDIATLLAGRTMEFEKSEGGTPDLQSWKADGTTIFHTYGLANTPRAGLWRIEGRRYCSDFGDPGAAREWTCFRVAIKEDGAVLEFTEIEKTWSIIQFTQFWRGRFVT